MYEIVEYEDQDGNSPFRKWLVRQKDKRLNLKVDQRLERILVGNFGDWKPLKGTDGICELRMHYGPGYRVYYTIENDRIVVLLIGSKKDDQDRQIEKAVEHQSDYRNRRR